MNTPIVSSNNVVPPKNPFFQSADGQRTKPYNFPLPSGIVTVIFPNEQPDQKDVTSLINYLELHCKNMGWEINEKEEN